MNGDHKKQYIVAITGASGSVYGIRLVQCLLKAKCVVHLLISDAGWKVIQAEIGWDVTRRKEALACAFGSWTQHVIYHPIRDIGAAIASGSYRVEGMIIMPCSMGTLSSIAHGSSHNLIGRAADVMMKEKRRLLLVPRETPLHTIHLENMLKLAQIGVQIVPAMPAFYHHPQTLDDMIHFLIGKVLDCLHIEHQLFTRWG